VINPQLDTAWLIKKIFTPCYVHPVHLLPTGQLLLFLIPVHLACEELLPHHGLLPETAFPYLVKSQTKSSP
jgi:hypothetical protein